MMELTAQPFFGFMLCIGTYTLGLAIRKRFNHTLVNPLLISSALIISILLIFDIPLENFMQGGNVITMFLAPATAALAVSMYRQLDVIKKNLIPILVGSVVGSGTAILSVILFCKLFGFTPEVTASLIPKSITIAFASKLSPILGGVVPITAAAISITGNFGALAAPLLEKIFRVNNPIATGLAVGAASHALGTSRAIEMGEVEGSVSGIAVGLCGLITIIIGIFL